MNNPYLPKGYKILDIKSETDIEYTFKIETDINPTYGQFLQVSVPRVGEAPISVSDFGDGWLDLTIRKIGKVTDSIFDLTPGDKLFLRGPYGNGFPLEELKDKHLVIVAGGSGVAPVRSIINYFYDNLSEVKKLDLLFGFKDPYSIVFKDDLEKWEKKIDTTITVDKTCDIWTGECVGLVTKYIKDIELSEFENMEIVVVGPPLMMKFTVEEFIKLGVPEEKILVSFERNMSCGLGKCGHCKIDEDYVCLEGPVFRYSETHNLID